MTYKRVLLKLSGEVFGGGAVGLDPDVVASIATEIAAAVAQGVQVAIVVGGGNFFRPFSNIFIDLALGQNQISFESEH